ncbi:MAG: AhpC/TSA family protein [Bacteroidota bacterium]|nr:AhpC/TSA family protein [Bacteroidota bacterium]
MKKKSLYSLSVIIVLILFFMNVHAQVPAHAEEIKPLLIGAKLPDAFLKDTEGATIQFSSVLKSGPSVLVFYRGGWCPYCNLQLSGLAKIEQEILELGYQVIAISPDESPDTKETGSTDHLNYHLFSDPDAKLIQSIGIGFQTPVQVTEYISGKHRKGKSPAVIPVPSVFITNTAGEIVFEYINPNYKKRISGEMLLAVLHTIEH